MAQIYCGNQANFPGLAAGTHVLGTNYQCLRKGIGIGSHLPYDAAYAQPHNPIDGRRFYCGNQPNPPVNGNYFGMGSPAKCLAIGVGVGKAQRAGMGPPAMMYFIRYILPYLLFFILSGGIFAIFYFTKPLFLTRRDEKNRNVIDWNKFVPYYLLACLILAILIWLFWRRFVRRWI